MSRIDPGEIVIGDDGKPLAKKRPCVRCPLDSRERLLQKLGTRWIRAHGANQRYRKSDAERADTLADVVAQADGPLPEYGRSVWYEGIGPVLEALPPDRQCALERELDAPSGLDLDPAVIGELRDSADAILADARVPGTERDTEAEKRDIALEVAGRLASGPIRSTRPRQLPVSCYADPDATPGNTTQYVPMRAVPCNLGGKRKVALYVAS